MLTPYWNVKDPKVTAVHTGKTEKRGPSGPLICPSCSIEHAASMGGNAGRVAVDAGGWDGNRWR